MPISGDMEPTPKREDYFPETQVLIDVVRANPKHDFRCSHGDGDGAVGIYEVPRGCVALPGKQTQTLCAQHRITDGSFEGMHLVVDLSVDGGWSKHFHEEPDHYIMTDPDTRELMVVAYADRPFDIRPQRID